MSASEPNEMDRQMAIFKTKIEKPDRIIKAHSMMKSEGKDGSGDVYWFLSNDDTLTMVDMREDETDE